MNTNLAVLRAIEEKDRSELFRATVTGDDRVHLDIVLLPLAPTLGSESPVYVFIDRLRAFCNSGRPLHEVRFHLNLGAGCNVPALMARSAAQIEAYVAVLLPYEGYKVMPTWYQAVSLGLPALGLTEWTVLRREWFLRKASVGAAMYAAGSIWQGLENASVDVRNSVARWLRQPSSSAIRSLAEHRIDARCLKRTLILHDGGRFSGIAWRDDFTDPADPFPRSIFNAVVMLLADARVGVLSSEQVDARFWRHVVSDTFHRHPGLASAVSLLQ